MKTAISWTRPLDVEGLEREFPEAKISRHVTCCIGNQGWRVFDVAMDDSVRLKL